MHPDPMQKINYTLDLTRQYYNLLGLEDTQNQKAQSFIWDGNVAGMKEHGVNSYYLQDDLGSAMNLTDEKGQSQAAYAYDEFGLPVLQKDRAVDRGRVITADDIFTNPIQPFGYTGYQMDGTTGLYFAQARRYDAGIGRFISEDKVRGFIEAPFTLNHYGYCWNNPVIFIDRDGRLATVVIGAIAGGLISGISETISVWNDDKLSVGQKVGKVLLHTAVGAGQGALIGTGAGLFASSSVMAAGDGLCNIGDQIIENKKVDIMEAAETAGISFVTNLALGAIFGKVDKLLFHSGAKGSIYNIAKYEQKVNMLDAGFIKTIYKEQIKNLAWKRLSIWDVIQNIAGALGTSYVSSIICEILE